MAPEDGYKKIIYFLVFFKFVFILFYTLNVFGRLFNKNIFNRTHNITLVLEYIFLLAMAFVLLYKFNIGNEVTIDMEERFLVSTVAFVLVINSILDIWSIRW
jgi:hypothetical protein